MGSETVLLTTYNCWQFVLALRSVDSVKSFIVQYGYTPCASTVPGPPRSLSTKFCKWNAHTHTQTHTERATWMLSKWTCCHVITDQSIFTSSQSKDWESPYHTSLDLKKYTVAVVFTILSIGQLEYLNIYELQKLTLTAKLQPGANFHKKVGAKPSLDSG